MGVVCAAPIVHTGTVSVFDCEVGWVTWIVCGSTVVLTVLCLYVSRSAIALGQRFSTPPGAISVVSALVFLSNGGFPVVCGVL